jgi:hypothetical protein
MASAATLLVDRLTALLGPQAAQSAVNTFCKRTVGVAPENLTATQLKLVLPSFKPMLSILIGTTQADGLLANLTQELSK